MTTQMSGNRHRGLTVQKSTFNFGLHAAQAAAEGKYESWNELRIRLEDEIPFNSLITRQRRVRSLFQWAFRGGDVDSLAVRVWRAYRDEALTRQVLKGLYLDTYPILGEFVSRVIGSIPVGSELSHADVENYLLEAQVGGLKDSISNLRSTMRDMGFIRRVGSNYLICENVLPGTAFLILLHYHLVPQPATLTVSEIVRHSFWQNLGGREVTEVRSVLSEAAAYDVLSRYSTVDNLEQVTTRFSLEELVERRLKLD